MLNIRHLRRFKPSTVNIDPFSSGTVRLKERKDGNFPDLTTSVNIHEHKLQRPVRKKPKITDLDKKALKSNAQVKIDLWGSELYYLHYKEFIFRARLFLRLCLKCPKTRIFRKLLQN